MLTVLIVGTLAFLAGVWVGRWSMTPPPSPPHSSEGLDESGAFL